MALTGLKGSELGMDLALCRAKPALLMFLHPLLLFLPFCGISEVGVQSSMALATMLSGLHEIYLRPCKKEMQQNGRAVSICRPKLHRWTLETRFTHADKKKH